MTTRRTTPFKATKLGTIGRSRPTIPVLTYDNKKKRFFSNSRLVKALKENPMSYKLPPEYIWNTASNKIDNKLKVLSEELDVPEENTFQYDEELIDE